MPHTVSLRLDPLALARFEGLLAAIEKAGVRGSREQTIMDGLEALLASVEHGRATKRRSRTKRSGAKSQRVRGTLVSAPSARAASGPFAPHQATRSPYQVAIRVCPSCRRSEVATSRGDLPLTHQEVMSALVDADVIHPDLRRRATISPRIRRAVLERDNHTCRAPGCNRRHGLTVHHVHPVEAGGANEIDNYATYCDRCHPALHAAARRMREEPPTAGPSRAAAPRSVRGPM